MGEGSRQKGETKSFSSGCRVSFSDRIASAGSINMPVNAQAPVKDRDTPIRLRMIELVTLILEHCHIAQHREPMRETLRYEELTVVILRQAPQPRAVRKSANPYGYPPPHQAHVP